jgi:hypothetical protein
MTFLQGCLEDELREQMKKRQPVSHLRARIL